ncbi:MAG: transketolase C-terminal domain-containing protein [Acidimicrobiales bacterium]
MTPTPEPSTEGQDQSEVFVGTANSASRAATLRGIETRSIPAFVAGEELAELADHDERIVVLTADLASANRLNDFAARHPDRFFNMGIAEKNMITVAAGMASTGLIPFAGTFASFAALLGYEQIRTDCAYPKMPVRILAHHSGISLGYYGSSHHATEDLAAMRAVAGLTVACAVDANQLRAMLRASLTLDGPLYLRLGRGRDPEVYSEVPVDFEFGPATQLANGDDLTILATGSEVSPSLAAARLLGEQGLSVQVIDVHTIKPLDVEAIARAATQTRGLITVEEHNIIGGLGGAVAETLADLRIATPLLRHGINDLYSLIGPPAALYAHYHLDAEGIREIVTEFSNTL